ncbi:MAG: hypothetical protein Q9212_001817 [Teloschistes hypoglaucus]
MRSSVCAAAILALSVGYATAGVQYGGVNIAGFDFGCDIQGACDTSKVVAPLHQYKGKDGAAQMQHFVKDDGLNAFRLPVGWQWLVDSPGSPLNAAHMEEYDALVQACLATGSLCIIDIHNYARWDGLIIGQGGPTDEQFADLWSQLATKYAKSPKVTMGIVNEPHEGNGYTSAGSFVNSGSAAALSTVKDVDGTTDKLIFEVHKYLDSDNSGTHTECVSSYVDKMEDLTTWLKNNKRQAILAETGGGGSTASCLKDVCELLSYLNDNSDVYSGYLGWGAGSFDATYELSLTPEGTKDVPLMTQCFSKMFTSGGGSAGTSPSGNSTTTPETSGNSTTPSGDTGSGNTASGNTTSGNTGSGNSNTGNTGFGTGNTGTGSTGNGTGNAGTGTGNTATGSTGTGNTGGGNTTSENTGTGNTGTGSTGTGNTGTGNTNSGNNTSENMGSGNTGTGNTGTGNTGTGNMGSGNSGAVPPSPGGSSSSAPYPTPSSGGSGGGGMPMPTGGLPGGQGGYQPSTFVTSTTSSPPSQGSGSFGYSNTGSGSNTGSNGSNTNGNGQNGGGAAQWGSKSKANVAGSGDQLPDMVQDDECEAD